MSPVCLNCKKDGKTMVELTCEHDLCLDCAESIKVAEGVGPLDAKFRISCPTCRKSTITLNIQNLVNKQNQKLLFVNMQSSQLSEDELQQQFGGDKGRISESKLRKMSYTQRRSSVYAQRRTPEVFDRNNKVYHESRASNNRSRAAQILQVKCSHHKEPLMFYCEQQSVVMCMQCMYKHMKQQKNHNVSSLTDALPTISKINLQYKAQARFKIEDIDKNLTICKGNKSRIQQAYEIHYEMIGQEFRELEKLIKKKQAENREHLEKVFRRKQEQISEQIKELNYIKGCMKQHFQFHIDNSSSQVYFFNAFNHLKTAISKYTLSYKPIKKEQFFYFDKFASLDDFLTLLQRFYRPKEGGRQSKSTAVRKDQSNGPSRASEKGNSLKMKEQFYVEAKKKLEKLNKMENEHNFGTKKKNTKEQYLQNFFIQEMGRDLDHSYRPPGSAVATYRKSSASEYVERKGAQKTLTPTRITPTPTHTKKKGK